MTIDHFFLGGGGGGGEHAGGVCSEGQIWSKERDSFLWELTLVLDHRIWVGWLAHMHSLRVYSLTSSFRYFTIIAWSACLSQSVKEIKIP